MRFFLLALALFFTPISAFAVTISSADPQIGNTDAGGATSGSIPINPGDNINFRFAFTNNQADKEVITSFILNPSDLLNGELNQYSAASSSYTAYFAAWKQNTQFRVHTNTSSALTYDFGSLGVDAGTGQLIVYFTIPANYNKPSLTFSLTPNCPNNIGGCSIVGVNSKTVSVNVVPSLSGAAFASSVKNGGVLNRTTTLTVNASDPSGISDISSVKIDLSSVGGSSAFPLYDDGSNGDTGSADGIFTNNAIQVSDLTVAGDYPLTLTVTDSGANVATSSATLTVLSAGAPIISLDGTVSPNPSLASISNQTGFTSSNIAWKSSLTCGAAASQGFKIVKGGTAGNPDTGTLITDWNTTCVADTQVITAITNTNLDAGANTIYVYVKTTDNELGYLSQVITKDLTNPIPALQAASSIVDATSNASVQWNANEAGTYTLRIGGTAGDKTSGVQSTGANASGSYSAAQAIAVTNISATILNADLAEGVNNIYLYFTDIAGNTSYFTYTVTKDSTPAAEVVTAMSLSDNDTVQAGVDGQDFSITWTEPADADSRLTDYYIFLYKSTDNYDVADLTALRYAVLIPKGNTSWTGNAGIVTDGKGNVLAGGSYRVVMISKGQNGHENSAPAYSATVTISAEDSNPPTFVSAQFISGDRIKLTFDKNLSTTLSDHDVSKISSSAFTVNTGLGTNGIQQISAASIYLYIQPLNNLAATASDLSFTASYVQHDGTDSTDGGDGSTPVNVDTYQKSVTAAFVKAVNGVLGPVGNRGTVGVNIIPDADKQTVAANVTGNAVSDGQAPNPLVINSPTAGTKFATSSLTVNYTIPEAILTDNLKIQFVRSGGATDANSPHTIKMTNLTSGTHDFIFDVTSFTSLEHGAADFLKSESEYTLYLSATDVAGNVGTTVNVTNILYDSIAPSIVTLTNYPTTTGNLYTKDATQIFNWSAASDTNGVDHYFIEVSLLSDFSVLAASSSIATGILTWSANLGDEAYYWRVKAYDATGNFSSSVSDTFVVDTTGPIITVNSTPSLQTLSALTVALNAASDGTGVGNNLDGYSYSLFKADADCVSNASVTAYSTDTSYAFTSLPTNTKYCFKIKAKDGLQNESSLSAAVYIATLATQVNSVFASAAYTADQQVVLNWTNQGQSGLKIEQDAACDGTYETTVLDNTSFTNATYTVASGLTGNTCYQFKISSYNSTGQLNTGSAPTIQQTTLPDVPTSLINNSNTNTSVSFDWADVTGATSYKIYETDNAGNSPTLLSQEAVSTFNKTGLAANTQLCVKVAAVSAIGEGGKTSFLCAYSSASLPQSLSFSTKTTSGINWSWLSGGAQSAFYAYTASPVANSTWTTNLFWNQAALSPNTSYQCFVKARNTDLDETAEINTTIYTKIEDPVLSFGTVTSTTIDLNTTVSNLGGTAAVFVENLTSATNSSWVTVLPWQNTGLTPNTEYSYRIKARNGNAEETSFSVSSAIYTLAAVPSLVAGETLTNSQISVRLNAQNNPNGTAYQIYFSTTNTGNPTTNPGDWTQLEDWTAHNNDYTFNHTGLALATTYYYQVRARSAAGTPVETSWSASASATTDATPDKLIESNAVVTENWGFADLTLNFQATSDVGIAYYRYKADVSAATDLNADATCIDAADVDLKKWGTGGTPADLVTDLATTLNTTGEWYLHFVSCNSGIDTIAGTADDVRTAYPQLNFGSYKIDKVDPTISDDYASDGVLAGPTQTVTLSPVDTGGSTVNEVKYCLDDATNDCDPLAVGTVLANPYQLNYSTSLDSYIRYQVTDVAGNSSAVGVYHVMVDANAPIVNTVTTTKTNADLITPADGIYRTGDTIKIAVSEQNVETGLTATVTITSVTDAYDSGAQAMPYDAGNSVYSYTWDSAGRSEASDYVVTITLTDSVGNAVVNNSKVIQLDNTIPTLTVFVAEDASSTSQTLTNDRALKITSFTGTDAHSSVARYFIKDLTGDQGSATANVVDFILTSASNTYTLTGAEGVISIFAWVMDAANNISTSIKQLITLDVTNPTVDSFTLADQSSASAVYTNSTTVNIPAFTASDTNGITKFYVTESATTPTVEQMNTLGAGAAQTTYTISGGEGLITLHAWVMDAAENIGTTTAAITLDFTAPTILSAQLQDIDSDGQIDKIKIIFSESVASTTSITAAAGFALSGHTLSAGLVSTTTATNDTVSFTVDETGVETFVMPDLTYVAASGNLQDLSENLMLNVITADVTELDAIAPVVTGSVMKDVNLNGKVDLVEVTFSENLQFTADDSAFWTLNNIPSLGTKGVVHVPAQTNILSIPINEGVNAADTSLGLLSFSYSGLGQVKDAVGNSAAAFSNRVPSDVAKPQLTKAFTQDLDNNGKIDALKLIVSESISDISVASNDFSISVGNSRVIDTTYSNTLGGIVFVNGFGTGSSADDATIYLKVSGSVVEDTGAMPTLSYVNDNDGSDLQDASANELDAFTNFATTDTLFPLFVSVTILDANADGQIDSAALVFSEPVNDSSLTVSGFSLGNAVITGMSTTLGGDSDANDEKITVTLSSGVSGTAAANGDLVYVAATGGLTDVSGNLLADRLTGDALAETDGAAPVIIAVLYTDSGTPADVSDDILTITFSESVSDVSLAIADFSIFGGGSIANALINSGVANDDTIQIAMGAGDTALTPGVSAVAFSGLGVISDLAAVLSTSTAQVTTNGAIIINEIAWGGTAAANTTDEFIELRNLMSAAIDFSVTPHALYINGTLWKLLNTGTIPGSSYFLVSRYDVNDGASTLLTLDAANLNHTKDAALAAIPDTALQVKIYKGTDDTGILLDTADDGVGAPVAGSNSGSFRSMERNNAAGNGQNASSWHSSDGSVNLNVLTSFATPKAQNVYDGQSPSFSISPETRTPVPGVLRPDSSPTISVEYLDNVGGSGIDAAEVKLFLDIDQNLATSGTSGSTTMTGCEVDKTSSATITTGKVSLTPSAALPAGRYRACVLIKDLAGNESTSFWDFWIDALSFEVVDLNSMNVYVQAFSPEESNIQSTKLIVQTYGAGFDLKGSSANLQIGADTISPWDGTNGLAWKLTSSEVVSSCENSSMGTGVYAAMSTSAAAPTSITTKAKYTDLSTTNCLKTYNYYIQYKVNVSALQEAGNYTTSPSFTINLEY